MEDDAVVKEPLDGGAAGDDAALRPIRPEP